jgi:hypothetical protein
MRSTLFFLLLLAPLHPLLSQFESESEMEAGYEDDNIYLDDSTYLRETRSSIDYQLGQGVTFSLEDGNYTFNLGGFIQPYVRHEFLGNQQDLSIFRVQRGRAEFRARAVQEGLSFLLSAEFVDNISLMDAWVGWSNEFIFISFGQKQVFTNNREMINPDNNLSLPLRSLLSREFSRTGREFGLFVEGTIGKAFQIKPKLAITSGDGRNSFGRLSDDPDNGGLKYGGRLDILPLGAFTRDGELYVADLYREPTPKLIVGAAYSFNNGASDAVGEGHGTFLTLDEEGNEKFPDYHQFYADVLFKWSGFSLLAEFANGFVTTNEVLFDPNLPTDGLFSPQYATRLAMGNAFNIQASYFTPINLSVDLRFSTIHPEFEEEQESVLLNTNKYTAGISYYAARNALKIQLSGSYQDFNFNAINDQDDSRFLLNLLAQLTF